VDILATRFPRNVRKVSSAITLILSTGLFTLAAWKVAQHATNLMRTGELSETTRMPFYPFTYAVAISCGLLAFCLFVDLVSLVASREEKSK
jgi:TRAP-type C4-dicarboxylate transport system permease small subunit